MIQEKNQTYLKQKQREVHRKAFTFMLELIGILGLPAAVAVVGGKWLRSQYGMDKWIIYILLVVAFILSWVIILRRVKTLGEEIKEIDKQVKEEKEAREVDEE